MHWADDYTLKLLTNLLGHAAFPLLVILVFRDDPIEINFENFYATLTKSPQVTHLQLNPLKVAEVQDLIKPYFKQTEHLPKLETRLLEETRGNPLYLVEYVRAICGQLDRESGIEPETALQLLDTPPKDVLMTSGLQHFIHQRLSRLTKSGQSLAEIGAVYGFRFDIRHVQAVCEMDENCLAEAVEELEKLHVVSADSENRLHFCPSVDAQSHSRQHQFAARQVHPSQGRRKYRTEFQAGSQ